MGGGEGPTFFRLRLGAERPSTALWHPCNSVQRVAPFKRRSGLRLDQTVQLPMLGGARGPGLPSPVYYKCVPLGGANGPASR